MLLWILLAMAFAVLLILVTAYICFVRCFYAKPDKREEGFALPEGEIYRAYGDKMRTWYEQVSAMRFEEMTVTSFDGLTLKGRYYECVPGAPVELMVHGYRGNARRDLCGGVERCFRLKRNVLIVDQRACGESQGSVITFGINESRDCAVWVQKLIERFGSDVKIILTGISMGASTVLMAAARELPKNVVGVLADCGYTAPEDIIKKTIREMHLPPNFMYNFVRLGAKLFGKFDLNENSPLQAVENIKLPVIFFHGEDDAYVPSWMSKANYDACTAPKRLVYIKNAGHGLSYPVDPEGYLKNVAEFFTENGVITQMENLCSR